MQHLCGAADGANLHDGVENFYVPEAHRFILPLMGRSKARQFPQHIGKNPLLPPIKAL